MFCVDVLIGASLSEPHIDRTSGRFPWWWYDRRPRAALGRTKIRKSTGSRAHMLASANFTVSLEPLAVSFDSCSMSSTNHQRASATNQRRASAPRTPESETDKRERLLQRRRERERDRRDSETAVQREERLSRRRMRD